MNLIRGNSDPFGGVIADPTTLPDTLEAFRTQLARSILQWLNEGYRVIWLEIPISKVALAAVAVESGFTFHHSGETYLLMTRQLVENSYIPTYATHYIGVGGVVINRARELLVVSEKYRQPNRGPAYKLPGGALQPGEHLAEAAVREVLEETGVRTRFEFMACFRHWHGYRFGKSDIYFVCRLSPLSTDISVQTEEIDQCLWMPVDEFLASEDISLFNQRIVRAALGKPAAIPTAIEWYGDPARFEFFMPEACKERAICYDHFKCVTK